jgi:phospholipase C
MTESRVTRRRFVEQAGAAGVAVLGGTLWRSAPAAAAARRVRRVDTPIRHLVIACQENRSYDHYFGAALGPTGYGPPAGYFQPDSYGGKHFPFEFTSLTTPDPPHGWGSVHNQYDGGKMDGFWQEAQNSIGSGDSAIGYYTERELPFYYGLLANSALNANYFCSLLGPTWPNRFYFAGPLREESRPTGSGATASSTIRSSSTSSTRPA